MQTHTDWPRCPLPRPRGFPELHGERLRSHVSREAGAKDNWVTKLDVALFAQWMVRSEEVCSGRF